MMDRISGRDRRTLAMGAVVIAALILFAKGIPAWRRWDAGVHASAAEMTAEAARAEQTVRLLPAMLDSLEARKARFVALGGALLAGGSPAASGAALASLVSGAGARAGVQIGSVQIHPDTATAGTFLRVSVRADGTGDLPAITRMLALLEGAPELLAVRSISITQPNPGGPAEQPEALRLELAVEGLALADPERMPAGSGDADAADPDAATLFVDTLPAKEGVP